MERAADSLVGDGAEGGGRLEKTVREKNPAAVALGRLGGAKGGKARAAKLTPERRADIAKKAALARWSRSGDEAGDDENDE